MVSDMGSILLTISKYRADFNAYWIQLLSVKFMPFVFIVGLDDCNPNPCGPGERCIDKIGGYDCQAIPTCPPEPTAPTGSPPTPASEPTPAPFP